MYSRWVGNFLYSQFGTVVLMACLTEDRKGSLTRLGSVVVLFTPSVEFRLPVKG